MRTRYAPTRRHGWAVPVTAVLALVLTLLAAPPAAGEGQVDSTDFCEHPVGHGVPDGWAEHWGRSHYRIEAGPCRLVKTSVAGSRHLLAWEDVGAVEGDVEVATLVRVPWATLADMSPTRFELHLHAGGPAGSIDTYHVDYTGTGGQGVRIRRSVNQSQSTLATAPEPLAMHAWHHVVFQRRGDALRAKLWAYGTDEPEAWTVEATDASHHSGLTGIGYPGSRVTQEFAWFSVATGGRDALRAPDDLDGAPRPQRPGPIAVTGEARHGAVLLDWAPEPGADHYEIERDGELVAHGWEIPSYADATRQPGTTATWRVRGVSVVAGPGEWSAPVEVQAAPVPGQLARPFEQDAAYPWTTHAQELDYLDDLVAASPRVGYAEVGRSGLGRPIHLVRFGLDGPPSDAEVAARPTLLLIGGNHGDEKAGREGVLFMMRTLAVSEDPEVLAWLDAYAILVVPTMNPDGTEAHTRQLTVPPIDGNRDNLELTAAETRTIAKVLRDHKPNVVVDAHEWAGSPGDQRGEFEVSTHGEMNAHEAVRSISQELAFHRVMAETNRRGGFRTTPYQELYSGAGRLRQMGGLKHALTLLTEGSRHPEVRRLEEVGLSFDATPFRPRRVASQRFALTEALNFLTEHVDRVVAATTAAVAAAEANEGPVYTAGSVAFPPGPADTLDPPPCGWVVRNSASARLRADLPPHGLVVADVLDLHGIEWEPRIPVVELVEAFVPAAQRARPVAVAALDPDSAEQLSGLVSERVEQGSAGCPDAARSAMGAPRPTV